MIIAFSILAISLLAMAAMLAARLYEIKAGTRIFAVGLREWIEKRARQLFHIVRGMVQVAVTGQFWTGLMSYTWRKFVEKVWHHPHVQNAARKATDVVRGKKEIKSKGPVSFYLKDVSDYKKDLPS